MLHGAEASLALLEAVQTKLTENQRDLQREIDSLKEELRQNQDPNRMQLIQEMISVRACFCLIVCAPPNSKQAMAPLML